MIDIQVKNLVKNFGVVTALDNVSFNVKSGEIFFLLGPSGCGKTTLLRTLAGFHTPDKGQIFFGSDNVGRLPPHKRKTGMVFQSYALWPHMSVYENVAFGLYELNFPKNEVRQRVMEVLSSVQMEPYAERKPSQLSGGQQQRVALARALVIRPRCLLMDEPLSNLDARLRYYMRLEIQRICKEYGLTTVYVTHDQKEALSIADRMAVLSGGKIQQVGSPEELYRRPHSRFIADFLGATNIIEGKVLNAGAGEAYVETPFGNYRGVIASTSKQYNSGDSVRLSIRPECFRLLDNARDENCVPGSIGRATYYGEVAHYRFLSRNDNRLKISELNPKHLGEAERSNLFAWVDPEDVVLLED